jgi:hypothetical protein
VTGRWRTLNKEEFRDLYSSSSIIRIIKSRRMRWVGNVARLWEKKVAYRLFVGKAEGKRPLGKTKCPKMLRNYGVAAQLAVSRVVLNSVVLVT